MSVLTFLGHNLKRGPHQCKQSSGESDRVVWEQRHVHFDQALKKIQQKTKKSCNYIQNVPSALYVTINKDVV